MKTKLPVVVAFFLGWIGLASAQHRLDVEVHASFGSQPLAFDTLALPISSGQSISLTRLDMLLSGVSLQKENGEWIGAARWVGYLNIHDGRNRVALANIPEGKYIRLRFQIGLPAALNHSDPAQYPEKDPLNPLVNGLHWGWQGGYVFAAIEGRWRGADGTLNGFSYHLANDPNLMTVELPLLLDLKSDQTLQLALDAREIFKGLTITEDLATTHSRAGDPLASQLCAQLIQAFRILSLAPTPTREMVTGKSTVLIGPQATPYRLTYSASFPRPALPLDNPLTEEGVALGERLFHDRELSGNERQSCAACHRSEDAFAERRRVSRGAEGDPGRREAMPLYNLAWKSAFFWDGRAASLREQVLMPIQNPIEMHASLPEVVERLKGDEDYPAMFGQAFGSNEINADRVARALEQYLLTIVSFDSKYDRALAGKEKLSDEEQRGFVLFNTEFDPARGQRGADCFHCHGGPLFQSVAFANNGLKTTSNDQGRFEATGLESDRGKFAVPSLRNVVLTAPYMHDGRFRSLAEVVAHYDHGVERAPTLDPNLARHPEKGLQLSPEDQQCLVAFLKTLTDDQFQPPPPPPWN